ncbi:lauroyl-Kdo(2)-lipid IV(A) myristoyltransferase, partial [Escherichia coli]|nr:lauroyl-Kdo(2)-lipid IV(A) myristoyltransferase [Escherichia coli]ELK5955992.1 lauroyl-Kdo(2)-lipid IV(A) myristoyltransferase [Escherichia coli]
TEREIIVDKMFATALQSIVMMAELAIRGPEKFQKRVFWKGLEILEEIRHNNRNVIFLVPHGWSVDIPAMLLAAQGKKMAAMFHQQRNPVIDYVWNSVRRKFGGRLHAREDGIKPFIQSVRQGYWGYYLPDQDHGPEYSEFADFFATYKATLPIIGRLMNIGQAMIIPLFPVYDEKKHLLTIEIRPPMDACIASADNKMIARQMNKTVEILVGPHPEQYAWVLKLLKTRKSNEADPYP